MYSDGGKHCFSCGYHVASDAISQYCLRRSTETRPQSSNMHYVSLPEDAEPSYPDFAARWCEQYEISRNQLLRHKVLWSDSRALLIFPYYSNGGLYAWQGRYFGKEKRPKWISYGKIHETLYVLGEQSRTLVCVEDILSAIKVSRYVPCLPLFGSYINTKQLLAILQKYDTIYFWLDPDKQKESLGFTKKASVFMNAGTILSNKDPKEHTYVEIGEILRAKSIITTN